MSPEDGTAAGAGALSPRHVGRAGSPLDRRLGRRIKALRLRRGIDEAAFAAALGVTVSLVLAMEAGDWSPPATRLLQIAGALGVPLVDLFAGRRPIARRRDAAGRGETPDERELLDFVRACLRVRDPSYRARLSQALAIAGDND
ncbi:MAG: helix-turn-helix domain-containing protein [Rhodospirillaceae bacterium]|nr:helix-turn-helix domain-containing protein [Rhodospirillaceae bacterium]